MNKLLLFLLISALLSSCNGNQNQQSESKKQETAVALEEHNSDVMPSYKRSGGDLVEEIYEEIAAKSTELKELEADVKQYHNSSEYNDITDKFNQYDVKSVRYYHSAEEKITNLKDSILRIKISNLVKKSKIQYADKIGELQGLISNIDKNRISIDEYYTVLKMIKTLPVIEKFQKDNLPQNKAFLEHIKQQEKLLNKIKNIIDK
jgi:predicted transcriptional regulator